MIQNKNIKQMLNEDGFCITRFSGNSMEPFLNESSDELLISAIKTRLKIGDVVLFKRGNEYVLHRIVKINILGVVTKGDNCNFRDGFVFKNKILGKLEGFWRDGDYVQVFKTWFDIRVAGIDIRIKASERQRKLCEDYLVRKDTSSGNGDSVLLDCDVEVSGSNNFDINTQFLPLESYKLFMQLGERLFNYDALLLHGGAVLLDGKAYIFVGPSGIGKSTHIGLLKSVFGDEVTVINGDKPILRLDSGQAMVFGTPWSGKEGWNRNVSAPLGGIVIFDRAKDVEDNEAEPVSRIERIDGVKAFDYLMPQVFMPADSKGVDKTLSLCGEMFKDVPMYHLWAQASESAVRLSYMTLTGKTGLKGQKQAFSEEKWEI